MPEYTLEHGCAFTHADPLDTPASGQFTIRTTLCTHHSTRPPPPPGRRCSANWKHVAIALRPSANSSWKLSSPVPASHPTLQTSHRPHQASRRPHDTLLLTRFIRIRERFPQINLSTVHRTLELLEELGLVTHAHFADHIARYHPVDLGQHHHLLCRNCGGIWELEDEMMHPLSQALQERYGFEADLNHLAIFGLCKGCRGQ